MPENNEELARILQLAGLEEADYDDEGIRRDDDGLEDFNAPKYIELYTKIAQISAEAVNDIKRWDADKDFDETRTWDLAERNMKPILQAIEEVYDIGTVLED